MDETELWLESEGLDLPLIKSDTAEAPENLLHENHSSGSG